MRLQLTDIHSVSNSLIFSPVTLLFVHMFPLCYSDGMAAFIPDCIDRIFKRRMD